MASESELGSQRNRSEIHRVGRIFWSVGAVLAGACAGILFSIGTDLLLHRLGVFPALNQPMDDPRLLVATVYRTLYGVGGSYIAARLAPDRPMAHALLLGVLGLIVNIVGTVTTWNSEITLGHHWYPIALCVLALPTAWAGGRLRVLPLPR